jgi:tripartite-type tricarboxylate transporter receptor subunit TctC
MFNHIRLFAGILIATCSGSRASARTPPAEYPTGTIRIVNGLARRRIGCGWQNGGRKARAEWGKLVIVENKTGAQGNLAMAYVAKAAPDGYTLAVVPVGNATVNPSLFKELPYDMKEFAPVSQIAAINNVLVVAAKSPARSLKELVALGKAKDARFTYSSPGAGPSPPPSGAPSASR